MIAMPKYEFNGTWTVEAKDEEEAWEKFSNTDEASDYWIAYIYDKKTDKWIKYDELDGHVEV